MFDTFVSVETTDCRLFYFWFDCGFMTFDLDDFLLDVVVGCYVSCVTNITS